MEKEFKLKFQLNLNRFCFRSRSIQTNEFNRSLMKRIKFLNFGMCHCGAIRLLCCHFVIDKCDTCYMCKLIFVDSSNGQQRSMCRLLSPQHDGYDDVTCFTQFNFRCYRRRAAIIDTNLLHLSLTASYAHRDNPYTIQKKYLKLLPIYFS